MVNYQVIMLYDEELGQSYFDSYTKSDDTSLGNITTTTLPPYADKQMAKACTYDMDAGTWSFDETKYAKILAAEEAAKKAAEEAAANAAQIMTNAELTTIVLELSEMVSTLMGGTTTE